MRYAYLLNHLFYAFAELYIDNGQYNGFKVQGSEARFVQIAALKQKNPNLKISISFANTIENGDNKNGGGFSVLAKSEVYRKAFALDCKGFLQKRDDVLAIRCRRQRLHPTKSSMECDNEEVVVKSFLSLWSFI